MTLFFLFLIMLYFLKLKKTFKNIIKNDNIYIFNTYLNKIIISGKVSNFLDIYKSFNIDFFNIVGNNKEWKRINTITSVFYYLNKINIFLTEYKYLPNKKCNHNLKFDKKKFLLILCYLVLIPQMIIILILKIL
jgi:hypothetical protein